MAAILKGHRTSSEISLVATKICSAIVGRRERWWEVVSFEVDLQVETTFADGFDTEGDFRVWE